MVARRGDFRRYLQPAYSRLQAHPTAPPRGLVWKAWTDPERMKLWRGPKDFTAPVCKIDFRVGGAYYFCMRSPEGTDYWSTGVYREIIEKERIVCTDNFADGKGNVVSAGHYGMEGDKLPADAGEKIMHIALPIGHVVVLVATDALESMGHPLTAGNNFHISIQAEKSKCLSKTPFGARTSGCLPTGLEFNGW